MNFQFNSEEIAFRQEVTELIDKELPADWVAYVAPTLGGFEIRTKQEWQLFKHMARLFGQKGWLALTWSKEYDRQSQSHMRSLIFVEEVSYRGAPGLDRVGVQMLAPTLIKYGSEDQKRSFLEPIAKGETCWCEAFSEPGAGSDLASLQTRATKDGHYFTVNGQKTWTTNAHIADWCVLLARTDMHQQRHRGLGFFLIDIRAPGITVRPLRNMAGGIELNEVFFDDVRVPRENMVGEENQGWYIAMDMLSQERASIPPVAIARRIVDELTNYMKNSKTGNERLARELLVQMVIEMEIARLLCYRVAFEQDKGIDRPWVAAISRVYQTKMFKHLADISMQLLGLYGLLDRSSKWTPLKGTVKHLYLNSFAGSLATGTSEIQKNVIARIGLGLPI
jgi:alkylation response protein AidB-like acyl-CoA dehydrogenase